MVDAEIVVSRATGSSIEVPSGATKPEAALTVSASRSKPTGTEAVRVFVGRSPSSCR
ncbi:Uncharacterised protein [Mycobacterium tuberculosis]|uniref:Uncharacterized protein n=1 Tax=Mycobacterium tuberculosis TaxID=1773 RepID=A0A654ZGY7_MYCTX|nr:Uncharacterised protein [Mycobacterium tuberculosis]CKO29331.1 Uncharacterised protein [Mycobacterium tuberculosis]CKT85546.1 Uncharacterised protein [Mycobacterium tuberculosis]CKT95306.1 Uncharacterised protein [Mycobacterium tuberculosis]CNV11284.1 Uncharacterised protein [Mycobacterium tuberculosis]